ncbi:MAG: DHHA1 domain-containing protein [Nitrososphaerales archaeon]
MGLDELRNRSDEAASMLLELAKKRSNILVYSHYDADGIAAASILAKSIWRAGGNFTIRICPEMLQQRLSGLEAYDLVLFCDLGMGWVGSIGSSISKWAVIDHHKSNEANHKDNVINSWSFGIDGGHDVCTSSMAYLIAAGMEKSNQDLAWIAVVAALADRQDQSTGRVLTGINKAVLDDAIEAGSVSVSRDLIMYGRETRPIHKAIATTSTPYIPGLTGSLDACLGAVATAGISQKEDGRWRTLSDLSEQEKGTLLEAIIPYLSRSASPDDLVDELFGEVYTLVKEDPYSPLRDAREFGTFLNACGRSRRQGLGVTLCIGDRLGAYSEGEEVLSLYKSTLGRYIQVILTEQARIVEKESTRIIVGDKLVDENMLGPLASILSGMDKFAKKVLIVRTSTEESVMKCSVRKGKGFDLNIELGPLFESISEQTGGSGGGHPAAAGARIPISRAEDFLQKVVSSIDGKQS